MLFAWHMEEGVERDCCVKGPWCKLKLGHVAVDELRERRVCFGESYLRLGIIVGNDRGDMLCQNFCDREAGAAV